MLNKISPNTPQVSVFALTYVCALILADELKAGDLSRDELIEVAYWLDRSFSSRRKDIILSQLGHLNRCPLDLYGLNTYSG